MASEAELAESVMLETRRNHREGLNLLHRLLQQANNEISTVAGSVELSDESQFFRLAIIGHSLNAGWSALRLLETGYPRFALSNARYVREGHVVSLWAKAFPERARKLWHTAMSHDQGVRWPSVGEMGTELSSMLANEAPHSANTANWDELQDALRITHNEAFSHAVSLYSLRQLVSFDANGVFSPRVGPSYDAEAVSDAIDHLVPLLRFTLNDVIVLLRDLGTPPVSSDASELQSEAKAWERDRPIPLVRIPQFRSLDADQAND